MDDLPLGFGDCDLFTNNKVIVVDNVSLSKKCNVTYTDDVYSTAIEEGKTGMTYERARQLCNENDSRLLEPEIIDNNLVIPPFGDSFKEPESASGKYWVGVRNVPNTIVLGDSENINMHDSRVIFDTYDWVVETDDDATDDLDSRASKRQAQSLINDPQGDLRFELNNEDTLLEGAICEAYVKHSYPYDLMNGSSKKMVVSTFFGYHNFTVGKKLMKSGGELIDGDVFKGLIEETSYQGDVPGNLIGNSYSDALFHYVEQNLLDSIGKGRVNTQLSNNRSYSFWIKPTMQYNAVTVTIENMSNKKGLRVGESLYTRPQIVSQMSLNLSKLEIDERISGFIYEIETTGETDSNQGGEHELGGLGDLKIHDSTNELDLRLLVSGIMFIFVIYVIFIKFNKVFG